MNLGALLRATQDTAEELAKALNQSHPSGYDFEPMRTRLLDRCRGQVGGNISDAEVAQLIEAQEQLINVIFAKFREQNEESAARIN